MQRNRKLRLGVLVVLAGVMTAAGCSSLDDLLPDGDPVSGRLKILITDAPFPFDLVEEALVTITRIEVHYAGDGADDDGDGGDDGLQHPADDEASGDADANDDAKDDEAAAKSSHRASGIDDEYHEGSDDDELDDDTDVDADDDDADDDDSDVEGDD